MKCIEILNRKGNSESDFNENSYEKTEENQRRILVAKMMSSSMDPYVKIGENVPILEKLAGDEYYIKDIIAIDRGDGLYEMHQITNKYRGADGKIYYETQGLNRDTNPFPDTNHVSEDDVIGIADFSEEAFISMQESIEKRSGVFIKVYGSESVDLQTSMRNIMERSGLDNRFVENILERVGFDSFLKTSGIINKGTFQNTIKQITTSKQKILNSLLELTYKIHTLESDVLGSHEEFGRSRDKFLKILKPRLIRNCLNYYASSHLTGPNSYQLLELTNEIVHFASDLNNKELLSFKDLNREIREKYSWKYDITKMILKGTQFNNIRQSVLAEYVINLRGINHGPAQTILKKLASISGIFTKVYKNDVKNYFKVGKDFTGKMQEIKITGNYDRNTAFRILNEKMINALDIRERNPSKEAILSKAKSALFRFDGKQVSLIKYYHRYEDGNLKAGYIFIQNRPQDMGGLTTKTLKLDLRNRINRQYLEVESLNPTWHRQMDSESKGLRTIEYQNNLETVVESHYEIWSEKEICEMCKRYIMIFINNHNNIGSFIGYDDISKNLNPAPQNLMNLNLPLTIPIPPN